MKSLLAVFLCLSSMHIEGQEMAKEEFDGHKWEAPYHFPIPQGWTIERFLIPISFAPQIPYKGVEDIRFTPGWSKVASDEYWTYAFLWYLDGEPKIDANIIAANLKAYYTGLIEVNSNGQKGPAGEMTPVKTSFTVSGKGDKDLNTYRGTITMMDYMQQKPITLNCIVHLKVCKDDNKTIIFYALSPKDAKHNNWQALEQLWKDFRCNKTM